MCAQFPDNAKCRKMAAHSLSRAGTVLGVCSLRSLMKVKKYTFLAYVTLPYEVTCEFRDATTSDVTSGCQ
jgi:hypothetical protein